MPTIYIFRGKSATGKTALSNFLSGYLNIAVYRKDDIFDPLSEFLDNQTNSQASYDILASMINSNIKNGADIIVDIALPHTPDYLRFLSKFDMQEHRLQSFLCNCSDEKLWLSRWAERLKNPLPNQFFRSLDAVAAHYAPMDMTPLPDEVCIDSSRDYEELKLSLIRRIKEP